MSGEFLIDKLEWVDGAERCPARSQDGHRCLRVTKHKGAHLAGEVVLYFTDFSKPQKNPSANGGKK